MPRRNLILIHRGPSYDRDFDAIAAKVNALDPEITVFCLASAARARIPSAEWRYPTLTVAFVSEFNLPVERGPVLASREIRKYSQYRQFAKAGIPTPATLPFRFGMKLDPILFGPYVLLKPDLPFYASQGRGIRLFRRQKAEMLQPADFPAEHMIHSEPQGFLVQRFIDTGEWVPYTRVLTLLSEPLYSLMTCAQAPRPSLDCADDVLARLPITNTSGKRQRVLAHEEDVLQLARDVHDTMPRIPLLGLDIVREETTGRLYVIECNAGGNVWHFSSSIALYLRKVLGEGSTLNEKQAERRGRELLIGQFGALDRAAEVLVRRTRELAS